MKPSIAFAAVLAVFSGLGGMLFMSATSALSGGLYWIAFVVIGMAAGQKAHACLSAAEDKPLP